jgi:flagellar protein FlgJ
VSSKSVGPADYTDFSAMEGLKKNVKANDPKAIRAAAQQFESLFTNMMLKSMREAKLGEGMGDSDQTSLYQGMYDEQLAIKMSAGKGIGLADMLVQQLTRNGAAKAAAAAPATAVAAPASATAGATTPSASSAPVSQADRISFVRRVEPLLAPAAQQLGVAPETLIAQAALETGWGKHLPSSATGGSSLNLFGVKASAAWHGQSVSAATTEYAAGVPSSQAQPFRAYSSLQQGVNDYVTLLQRSSRYQGALGSGSDAGAFASALQRGGYATDPSYGAKVAATAAQVKILRSAPAATAPAAAFKFLAGAPISIGGEDDSA